MNRRIHRKSNAEQSKTSNHNPLHRLCPERDGGREQRRDDRQQDRPQPRCGHLGRQTVLAAPDQLWRHRLHQSVDDGPAGHEGADHGESPSLAVEENRHTDHEPDIARAEQEDARTGQQVDRALLADQLAE